MAILSQKHKAESSPPSLRSDAVAPKRRAKAEKLKCIPAFSFQLSALVACLLLCLPGRFGAQETHEYQVKGVLLYHLTQFVEWPAAAFATPEEPFTIGILGND